MERWRWSSKMVLDIQDRVDASGRFPDQQPAYDTRIINANVKFSSLSASVTESKGDRTLGRPWWQCCWIIWREPNIELVVYETWSSLIEQYENTWYGTKNVNTSRLQRLFTCAVGRNSILMEGQDSSGLTKDNDFVVTKKGRSNLEQLWDGHSLSNREINRLPDGMINWNFGCPWETWVSCCWSCGIRKGSGGMMLWTGLHVVGALYKDSIKLA